MLTLHHSFCFNGCPFISASLPLKINQKTSIIGIGWNCCKGFILLRRRSSLIVSAVEKESDFDVDPVKAREALRKLDEQLQSMAQKKSKPPKVRASGLSGTRDKLKEGIGYDGEIPGTFLTYIASGLIIFSIFYNILFLTVIKPAIDGPDSPETIEPTLSLRQAETPTPSVQP